jgi:hypothetical protein
VGAPLGERAPRARRVHVAAAAEGEALAAVRLDLAGWTRVGVGMVVDGDCLSRGLPLHPSRGPPLHAGRGDERTCGPLSPLHPPTQSEVAPSSRTGVVLSSVGSLFLSGVRGKRQERDKGVRHRRGGEMAAEEVRRARREELRANFRPVFALVRSTTAAACGQEGVRR